MDTTAAAAIAISESTIEPLCNLISFVTNPTPDLLVIPQYPNVREVFLALLSLGAELSSLSIKGIFFNDKSDTLLLRLSDPIRCSPHLTSLSHKLLLDDRFLPGRRKRDSQPISRVR